MCYCAKDGIFDLKSTPHSKYVWYLFTKFLHEMRVMKEKGTLWMNHHELDREELREIRTILFGTGKVFDALSIAKYSIPTVQQFQWTIADNAYDALMAISVAEYVKSPQFLYYVAAGSDGYRISFHFRFYRQYLVEDPQCAIFLEIDEMPDEVKRLRIEVDMKCNKNQPFRQLLRTRVLSKEQRVTGFVTFDRREVDENEKMDWLFAMKILNVENVDEEEEILRDLSFNFE